MNMDTFIDPASVVAVPADQDLQARTRLLNAAVHIFDRKGYASASVREIAELAGVTKPVLYYYFGSKEGLLMAVLTEAQRLFTATVETAVARVGTARERIIGLCTDIYAMFEQHVPVVRVAHAVFLGPPEVAPPFDVTIFELSLRGAFAQIAADGVAAGEFRAGTTDDLAMAVMGILEGCNERQLHPAFEPVGAAGVRRLLDLLFDGVMNTPRV